MERLQAWRRERSQSGTIGQAIDGSAVDQRAISDQRRSTGQPRGAHVPVPVPVSIPVDHRSICSCIGTTFVMRHYFTTREARVIPPTSYLRNNR